MRSIPMICVTIIFAAPVQAAQACDSRAACRAECEKIERRIERLHARMRSGYDAREGEKMQAELRRLRRARLRACR